MSASPLAQQVQTSLQQAQRYQARQRQLQTTLTTASVVASAVTTLLTGGTVTQSNNPNFTAWPLACGAAAVFSLAAAICSGLTQQLNLAERLLEAQNCLGRLRAIEVAFLTNSRPEAELGKEYEEIVRLYVAVLN